MSEVYPVESVVASAGLRYGGMKDFEPLWHLLLAARGVSRPKGGRSLARREAEHRSADVYVGGVGETMLNGVIVGIGVIVGTGVNNGVEVGSGGVEVARGVTGVAVTPGVPVTTGVPVGAGVPRGVLVAIGVTGVPVGPGVLVNTPGGKGVGPPGVGVGPPGRIGVLVIAGLPVPIGVGVGPEDELAVGVALGPVTVLLSLQPSPKRRITPPANPATPATREIRTSPPVLAMQEIDATQEIDDFPALKRIPCRLRKKGTEATLRPPERLQRIEKRDQLTFFPGGQL